MGIRQDVLESGGGFGRVTILRFERRQQSYRKNVALSEEICPAGDRYAPQPYPYLLLFLTSQGGATVQVDSGTAVTTLTHAPNTLIMVGAGCRLIEQVDAHRDWHLRYLLLRGTWADQMSVLLNSRENVPARRFPQAPLARRQLFTTIVRLVKTQSRDWQWLLLGKVAELLGGLLHEVLQETPEDALVLRIGELIDAEPLKRPTVAQLSAQTNMTPRQLIYRFQQATGIPLAQWIRRRRIATAPRLLNQGIRVSEVAHQLGFANPYHFSRTFTSVTDASPSSVSRNARITSLHEKSKNLKPQIFTDCQPSPEECSGK